MAVEQFEINEIYSLALELAKSSVENGIVYADGPEAKALIDFLVSRDPKLTPEEKLDSLSKKQRECNCMCALHCLEAAGL